ncbi:hypothetical protein KJ951_03115 [Patescibacteria group bacterium]|nr:hypothetical protein [Patescibacteria group bacterium]MBU1703369.1 hypothetical protein [Patescibacteria group bacterium]MBU1954072.1 hypothetical protein [Patescibacteria group bacterium]
MTTKIINIREYRNNITTLWKEARKNNVKYIVLVHSKPAFEVKPIDDDFTLEEADVVPTASEIKAYRRAMADYKKNKKNFTDGRKFMQDLIKKKNA